MPRGKRIEYPTEDVRLDSGAIIHWSRLFKGKVPITCWRCGDEFQRVAGVTRRKGFHGAHRECHHSRNQLQYISRGKEEIQGYGSIIDWARTERQKVPIQCGKCKKWRNTLAYRLTEEKRRKDFTGYCLNCYETHLKHKPLRIEAWTHSSGTKVFPGERDPHDQKKLRIICHNCHQSKFILKHNPTRKHWTGLCADCLSSRPSPKKILDDKVLGNGTIIQFSQEKNDQVPILYSKCRCVRWTARDNAVTNGERYGAVCNYHRNNSTALVERLLELAGHSSGNGNVLTDKQTQRLLIAINEIGDIWQRVRSHPRAYERRHTLITQLDLAPAFGIHAQDDKGKRSQVARLLKDSRVNDMFAGAQSWFRSFVDAVIEEIERQATPEKIIASLAVRLTPRSIAA